jgi:aminoglycoside 6'-N-acetyltransferase
VTTLHGEHVVLRDVLAKDIPALCAIRAEPDVALWWGEPDDGWPLTDRDAADEKRWTILLDDEVVGFVAAYQVLDPDYRHAGLDLFVSPQVRGRGLGTDAVRAVARYLLYEIGHHRLVIDPAASNTAAIRAYEKAGFRRVGIMREYERDNDSGTFHDGLLMDMLVGDLT